MQIYRVSLSARAQATSTSIEILKMIAPTRTIHAGFRPYRLESRMDSACQGYAI